MSGKLPGRPNLALSGKREAPGVTPKSEPKRGRGGGRGTGRGGARGGKRDAKPKQELIQTGGVFSEGLGGDFPSRRGGPKDADTPHFTVKRSDGEGKSKHAETIEAIEQKGDGKASFKSWDELWQSDDETDEVEKKALCPKGIISDLTRGSVLPCVLPVEDQSQFLNVLNKHVRVSLEEEEDNQFEDKKPIINGVKAESVKRKTAEELIAMFEASTSELMHIQLPSVVASICREIESQDEPMETDESQETRNDSGLPNSRNIGKIQVTRKGRILLRIGGHSIDITSKPTKGKQMSTVLLETEPSFDPMGSPPPQRFGEGNNAVYYMGNVKHNLVGSMTWNELNQKSLRNTTKPTVDEQMNETPILDAAHVRQIQELEEVQKSWLSQAEKWAIGKEK